MIFENEFKIRFVKDIDRHIGKFIIYVLYCLKFIFNRRNPSAISKLKKPKKFLLIKFFGIGNIFLILPSARILKDKFSDSVIDLLTISSNRGIAENVDVIDRAFYIKDNSFFSCLFDIPSTIYRLRKDNYDIVIDFEQFVLISAIFAFLSRTFSIGFKTSISRRHLLYSQSVNYIEDKHMEDIFKTLLNPICDYKNYYTKLNLNFKQSEDKVKGFLEKKGIGFGHKFIITIHPGSSANFRNRRWPERNFSLLTRMIIDNYDIELVFTGKGKDEGWLVESIISDMQSTDIHNACDSFGLDEFITLIKLSDLVITNDTAPVQIASIFDTPCISLFGPNTPFLYGPKNSNGTVFYKHLRCSPCITNFNYKDSNCNNPECMNIISVSEVFEKIEYYLRDYKRNMYSVR